MTTRNRLAKAEAPQVKMTPEEWADRGNRILAGVEPYAHPKYVGQFHRRDDVRWVVRNGHCVIEWVRPPSGSMVE